MKKIYVKPESTVYIVSSDAVMDLTTHSGVGDGDFSKDNGGEDMWEDEEDDL